MALRRRALVLHDLQLKIALRGADLLKVDGRLVYSTCSLNPSRTRPSFLVCWRRGPIWRSWTTASERRGARGPGWRRGGCSSTTTAATASPPPRRLRAPPSAFHGYWPPPMRAALPARRRPGRLSSRRSCFINDDVVRPFAAADAARLPALCGDLEVRALPTRRRPAYFWIRCRRLAGRGGAYARVDVT